MAQTRLLADKVAAITGGVTGIGRAIALEYLRQGAHVAVNHLGDDASARQFEEMQKEAEAAAAATVTGAGSGNGNDRRRLIAVPGDISKPETARRLVERTVDEFGRLDVFVSNAGVCRFADFLDLDTEHWNFTLNTNLGGAFHATQAAARQMASQGHGGSIIGVSSISALVGGGRQAHYTPTKAGVLSLMQSCACALGPHGIRCNALLPGTIRTQLNDEDLADPEKRRYMEGRIPLGRTGEPADLAGPAVFLASDLSRYVNGAQLLVDGGLFVNLQ
ncbi:short-chain dehydrogenase [Diplodia corticola]|uniref:Short-chain dehydrogenase n=1 Tax=Diplodia corticola TaxID=236234 RepID=A0A1J9R5H8_9PEZI|nr:short-chain dehydrogenase [Diplodia corticola]OJD35482.1 short-chain dehydrogenase [Diplodia corticola]